MRFFARLFATLAVLVLAVPSIAQQLPSPQTPAPENAQAVAIQEALTQPGALSGQYGLDLDRLRRFYVDRNYTPAWFGGAQQDRDAAIMISALEGAGADGLDPAAYRLDAIRAHKAIGTPDALAEFDLLLTAGALGFMHDLHSGRVAPMQVENDIGLPSIAFDPVSALSNALMVGTLAQSIASLQPPHKEYDYLKIALARYREIQNKGGWPEISSVPALKLDGDDPRLTSLWRRLVVDDPALGPQPVSDTAEALADAIKRYQARNGLDIDGEPGKATLAALNVPVGDRIDQIMVNMERWRWLPLPFPQRYIEVNAADATLEAIDHGNIVLTSRIIAGKRATPTPMFEANVEALTINPYWNIPSVIARNEIWPKERRHPGYMARENIFVAGDGTLKQRPGSDNALGYLKLEMPNRFNSYLHDTPTRRLFARNDRHFSHGCMRVQQIEPLASWVLTGDTGAAKEKLDALIATGVNQRIPLDNPLPVYVLYWTAIADQNGSVGFRSDIYGRDSHLLAALAGQKVIGRSSLNTDCQADSAG